MVVEWVIHTDTSTQIEAHPLVLQLELPRIFQITPSPANRTLLDDDENNVDLTRTSSSSKQSHGSAFISVKVLVSNNASDVDIFNLTLSATELILSQFTASGTQCTVDVRRV